MGYVVEHKSFGSLEKDFPGVGCAEWVAAYLAEKAHEGLELVSHGTGQAGLLFVFKGAKKATEHRGK